MPEDRWNKPDDGVSVEEQVDDPDSLLNFYRMVLNARNASPALSDGDFSILELDVSAPGGWGFVRTGDGEQVVGLFNFSNEPVNVTVKAFPFSAESLTDLLTNTSYPGSELQQPYTLNLPPASAVWLVGSAPK
jgi:glycosidase